jgi:hypothetical protein
MKETLNIPKPVMRSRLIIRMMVVSMGGFDAYMDQRSRSYIRILCRLIDKCYREYEEVSSRLRLQAESGDKLAHWEQISDHLENFINALARAACIFQQVSNDNSSYIRKLLDTDALAFLSGAESRKVRNRIEHLDEDIQQDKPGDGLVVRISDDEKTIKLGKVQARLEEVVQLLEKLDSATRQILDSTPNRIENGKPFYD